jgi:hypothetical protein
MKIRPRKIHAQEPRESMWAPKLPPIGAVGNTAFMRLCDEHPNVYQWASEAIKIPYRHPITGKYTIYVPDFFIVYMDKKVANTPR